MPNDKTEKVAHSIKEGAGAAFHGAHSALEATENAAMSAVDQTADSVKKMNKKKEK